jgi:hypothetical protein
MSNPDPEGLFSADPGARNTWAIWIKPEVIQTVQDVGWLSQEINEHEEKT